ncbi:MAG TPA: endonuclease/exonuclease/phosphatase family protein [Gemmataceae bacterium]|nr:endonuclease/exonuclease/phosphatase family protein [Gemmataceae bacterium]
MRFRLACLCVALASPTFADPAKVRVATYNIQELTRTKLDAVDAKGVGTNRQLRKAAEILQRLRPDVLLVNEIDYDFPPEGKPDAGAKNARLFLDRYLKIPQNGQAALDFDHVFFEPVNTGVPSGKDLNNNGRLGDPEDAFGFGKYPGQYGMALFSRFPIDSNAARTFRLLLWKDVPGHLIPDGQAGRPAFYKADQVAVLRLSSKSHWDVPVRIGETTVHLLCSHPTPPVFDGPEDRNGRRNHDEIRLWADYLAGGKAAEYIRDDSGKTGPLAADAAFVILGDLNAEPVRGDTVEGKRPIELLLKHPRVTDPRPKSEGGVEADGPDLADYKPYRSHGFGRLDYVLPSKGLKVLDCGVFWPKKGDPLRPLIDPPDEASDHRPVWVDLAVSGGR